MTSVMGVWAAVLCLAGPSRVWVPPAVCVGLVFVTLWGTGDGVLLGRTLFFFLAHSIPWTLLETAQELPDSLVLSYKWT